MSFDIRAPGYVRRRIQQAFNYIAFEQQAPRNAERWLENLWDNIESLRISPHRCGLAEEDHARPYQVRKLIYGEYLVVFVVDEAQQTVILVDFRHGRQQPRPGQLPDDPANEPDANE
jgi:plasmid stabilization system protein ParE